MKKGERWGIRSHILLLNLERFVLVLRKETKDFVTPPRRCFWLALNELALKIWSFRVDFYRCLIPYFNLQIWIKIIEYKSLLFEIENDLYFFQREINQRKTKYFLFVLLQFKSFNTLLYLQKFSETLHKKKGHLKGEEKVLFLESFRQGKISFWKKSYLDNFLILKISFCWKNLKKNLSKFRLEKIHIYFAVR